MNGGDAAYLAALRRRYQAAGKAEKGRILDEFCDTTGYHRKAAIRSLRQPVTPAPERRGRRRTYGADVADAVRRVWEASGRLCSKRLAPFLPELVAALARHDELHLAPGVQAALLTLSPATIDRLLAPVRRAARARPAAAAGGATSVKAQVPVRTGGEWAGVAPGAVQADLVAHCGTSTAGFSLTTLVVIDVATSWTECQAVWGKGQQRVSTALHVARRRFPLALREVHTDNGSEFLNEGLVAYCRRENLRLTRGRPYKKNDQAYVEQRNGAVIRRVVGYERYATKAAYEQLARVYTLLRLLLNFFHPVRKVLTTERVGSKIVKRFDRAQTPYQRLLAAGVLDDSQRRTLADQYHSVNPVHVRRELDAALEALWRLGERPPSTPSDDVPLLPDPPDAPTAR